MNICRICYETDQKLIVPCKCNGTMKYVHSRCLEKWRTLNIYNSRYYQCSECQYRYKLNYNMNFFEKFISHLILLINYIFKNKILGTLLNLYFIHLIDTSLINVTYSYITKNGSITIITTNMIISLLISIYSYNNDHLLTWQSSYHKNVILINCELIFMLIICYFLKNTFVNNYLSVIVSGNSRMHHSFFIEFFFYKYLTKKSIVIQ